MSFSDFNNNIISSDQLSDFDPHANWDQVQFEMSSGTGVPFIMGQAVVGHALAVPQPATITLLLGVVVAGLGVRFSHGRRAN